MSWDIDVVTNEITLSKKQSTQFVDILEKTWSGYSTYIEWVGEKNGLVDFFMTMRLVDDFYEHKDYLAHKEVQTALMAVGAEGVVTFVDLESDNRGRAWTHAFKNGKYTYAQGKVSELVDGRIVAGTSALPQVTRDQVDELDPRAPFEDHRFVITGAMSHISRSMMEEAIAYMGGRASKSLSRKTAALIVGADAVPDKLADASHWGIPVWNEATFLQHAGLATEGMLAKGGSAVDAPKSAPFGWYFEEYHVKKGDVVRDGFSRTDITGLKSKIKGFAYRITPVFTA